MVVFIPNKYFENSLGSAYRLVYVTLLHIQESGSNTKTLPAFRSPFRFVLTLSTL